MKVKYKPMEMDKEMPLKSCEQFLGHCHMHWY